VLLRQAKRYFLPFLIGLFLFLIPIVPVLAASSTYLTAATKYFREECKARAKGDEAAICFLYERMKQTDVILAGLNDVNEGQNEQIIDLQHRVEMLEASLSAMSVTPPPPSEKTVTFADNKPQPFDSDWIDVRGYQTIKINLSITGFITQYDVQYTNNPAVSGFTVQTTVNCNSGTTCPEKTLPIIGGYYRISTGTASGNVTATGLLIP
jgi:hypothetical protein